MTGPASSLWALGLFLACCCSYASCVPHGGVAGEGALLPNDGKIWAVLVGSAGTWWNYFSEANACRAYQSLRARGIPEKRIIVMFWDTIATDSQNPTPGKIVSRLGGPDVYHDVPKDYTGNLTDPAVLLALLRGNNSHPALRGRKTLDSGPSDHVFLYLTDHGDSRLVHFETAGSDRPLYSEDLRLALVDMHKSGRYGKMVVYVDACFSGSMFERWQDQMEEIDVYANTAASPDEPGWLADFDEKRRVFLTTYYTLSWLNSLDFWDSSGKSMEDLFVRVKNGTHKPTATATSTPCQYGSRRIRQMPVSDFFGTKTATPNLRPDSSRRQVKAIPLNDQYRSMLETRLVEPSTNRTEKEWIISELSAYDAAVRNVDSIVDAVTASMISSHPVDNNTTADMNCYKRQVDAFLESCNFAVSWVHFGLLSRVAPTLERLCAGRLDEERISQAIADSCSAVAAEPRIEII